MLFCNKTAKIFCSFKLLLYICSVKTKTVERNQLRSCLMRFVINAKYSRDSGSIGILIKFNTETEILLLTNGGPRHGVA